MISASFPVDLVQLVLAEQREDLVLVVDERHDLVERHAGDEEAGAQHDVHHRAVARREDGRLRQLPPGVIELGPGGIHLRLRDTHLCQGGGHLRLDLRDGRKIPVHAAAEFFAHLLLGGARRRDLPRQLVDARLRLLEIEAVARTGRDELGVLRHPFLCQVSEAESASTCAVA